MLRRRGDILWIKIKILLLVGYALTDNNERLVICLAYARSLVSIDSDSNDMFFWISVLFRIHHDLEKIIVSSVEFAVSYAFADAGLGEEKEDGKSARRKPT